MKIINTYDLSGASIYEESFTFIDNDRSAYINQDGNIIEGYRKDVSIEFSGDKYRKGIR